MVTDNKPNKIHYILLGPSQHNNNRVSAEIMQQLQRDFKDVFTRIGCFDATFSLQVQTDRKPYQVPPSCVAYALQMPFKVELVWLQQQDIITLLGVDSTAEWCNSFVLVLKPNRKVRV